MKSIRGKGIVRNLYPFLWRAAVVFFVAVISACGGGGGGGSSNPPPQDGLSVDKTTLIFTGEEGQSVASQSITGSITGATGPVILKIAYTNQGIQFVTFTQLTPTRGRVDVTPQPTVALAPGSYSDTITVYACYDAGCTQPVTGSPKRVSVSYTIQPRNPPPTLLLSDHGVAFASVPSGAHLTRTLSARDSTGAASTWSATSNESWLTVTGSGNSSGFLMLSANPVGLPDGSYEARV